MVFFIRHFVNTTVPLIITPVTIPASYTTTTNLYHHHPPPPHPHNHLNHLQHPPFTTSHHHQVLSAICLTLSLDFGLAYSTTMGEAFTVFLVTSCACLLVVSLLLFCYIISANSFNLIRSSVLVRRVPLGEGQLGFVLVGFRRLHLVRVRCHGLTWIRMRLGRLGLSWDGFGVVRIVRVS